MNLRAATRVARAVSVAIGAVLTPQAMAADTDAVADYRALKTQLHALEFRSTDDLTTEVSLLAGRTVELRGRVSGDISGPKGTFFIFSPEEGSTLLLNEMNRVVALRHGHRARVLFFVPPEAPTMGSLIPIAFIWEAQAAPVEARELALAARAQQAWEERMAGVREATVPHYRTSSDIGQTQLEALVRHFNSRLSDEAVSDIAGAILQHSRRYQVNELLACALVAAESAFNPWAVSRKGAMGLGQLMPGTARGLGVRDAFDPEENLRGSLQYFSRQLDRFDDLEEALAAYNAGPGAVQRYGGVPPYRETRNYVHKVSETFARLAERVSR